MIFCTERRCHKASLHMEQDNQTSGYDIRRHQPGARTGSVHGVLLRPTQRQVSPPAQRQGYLHSDLHF